MPVVDVRAVFATVAAAGPYFEVVEPDAQQAWTSIEALIRDDHVLRDRVGATEAALAQRVGGGIDRRVSASTNFLGLAARLVAPALATAAISGIVAVLEPDRTFWLPVVGGPIPIAVSSAVGVQVDGPVAAAAAIDTGVLVPIVVPLVGAYRVAFGLSKKILWGNVASALAGAATMLIRGPLPYRHDPIEIVQLLLARPTLIGTGHYEQPDPSRAERFFVRRSCCLFYRVPGGGLCGDCVLVPVAERELLWQEDRR